MLNRTASRTQKISADERAELEKAISATENMLSSLKAKKLPASTETPLRKALEENLKKFKDQLSKMKTAFLLSDDVDGMLARFEEGVSADPTKNMSPEDAAEWKRQHQENKDNFKSADEGDVEMPTLAQALDDLSTLAGTSDSDLSVQDPVAALEEMERLARFEEGVSVDVPAYLEEAGNPEAARKWEEMNEEHRDNFKTATPDNKDYKLAQSRLNAARKAAKAVPVREATTLSEEASKVNSALYEKHLSSSRANPKGPSEEVEEGVVKQLQHLHGQVANNLKALASISLEKGVLHPSVEKDLKVFQNIHLQPDTLAEAAGLAHNIATAASVMKRKAQQAEELVQFYSKWVNFFQSQGRAPSDREQWGFKTASGMTRDEVIAELQKHGLLHLGQRSGKAGDFYGKTDAARVLAVGAREVLINSYLISISREDQFKKPDERWTLYKSLSFKTLNPDLIAKLVDWVKRAPSKVQLRDKARAEWKEKNKDVTERLDLKPVVLEGSHKFARTSADEALEEMERLARFEEGVSVDVPAYLEEAGNPEAAREWEEMNEEHRDNFKTAKKLTELWIVEKPTKDSELGDILVRRTPKDLGPYIRGAQDWEKSEPALYDNRAEAEKDAKNRLSKVATLDFFEASYPLLKTYVKRNYKGGYPEFESAVSKYMRQKGFEKTLSVFENFMSPSEMKELEDFLMDKRRFKVAARTRLTTQAKQAGEFINLWAAVNGQNLLGATDEAAGKNPGFWRSRVGSKPVEIVQLKHVPMEIAVRLADQGTPTQFYSNGVEAWRAAQKYIVTQAKEATEVEAAGKPVGKAQIALMDYLSKNEGEFQLADIARNKAFLGVHMKDIMSAAQALKKKELVKLDGSKIQKVAAKAAGLYGFTKRVQSDCESATRKLQKAASRLAREAYTKDADVAPFLSTHVKRANSLPAKILTEAMKELGPKIASEVQAKEEEMEKEPISKEAGRSDYGLYGYKARTANLGLSACTQLREAAGQVAAGLHGRKADSHEHITGYLKAHAKEASCMYARMLHASYPDADRRCASQAPTSVAEWIAWED